MSRSGAPAAGPVTVVLAGGVAASSSFGSWVNVSYPHCAAGCPATWVSGGGGSHWVLVASLLLMGVGVASLVGDRPLLVWLTWSSALGVLSLSMLTVLITWARAQRFVEAAGGTGSASRSPGWAAVLCLVAGLVAVAVVTAEGFLARRRPRSTASDALAGTRSGRRRSRTRW